MNLEETRRRLLAMKNRGKILPNDSNNTPLGFRRLYAHWDMQVGESCIIRFVPDGDENRTFFQEHFENPIPFTGTTEEPNKPVTVYVPCSESPLYGGAKNNPCPIQRRIQTENWYKIPEMVPTARKYYRRASFHLQGFVRQNPIQSDLQAIEAANNADGLGLTRLRHFIFVKSLFTPVGQILEDPDLEVLPTDFEAGRNFRITVSTNGEYKSYSGAYSPAATPLLPEERAWIEAHGIPAMATLLPPLPTPEEQQDHYDMFEASLNGELLDMERYGRYLSRRTALSLGSNPTAASTEGAASAHAPRPVQKPIPARPAPEAREQPTSSARPPQTPAAPPAASPSSSAQELLARLKRSKAGAA